MGGLWPPELGKPGPYVRPWRLAASSGGDCPLFRAVLARIFANDAALIGFVQRALGYALTGEMAEQALFFAYGAGGNGKSVLLNTVFEILGGYAAAAPADAFTAVRRERDPTDLAMLQGARFVVAQEIAQGHYWDEARIKAPTGGDPFVARYRHGELFAHRPRFKLFIAGNHVPALRAVDPAMRRRLKLIPFAVTIPEAEIDRDLSRKLRAEWPGILGRRSRPARAMRARGFVACRIGKTGAKGFKGLALRRHSEASVMLAAMSGKKTPLEGL